MHSRMHRIEDAARLAMADHEAGERHVAAPAVATRAATSLVLALVALVAVLALFSQA